MVPEIMAAIQGVRLIGEMAQKGHEVSNANQINSAIAETLSKLNAAWAAALEAQEQKAALAQRVGGLEKEVAQLKDWEREKERYALAEITPGIPTYVLQSEIERGTTTHRLCANCFDSRQQKAHLQFGPYGVQDSITCSQCKGEWFPAKGRHVVSAQVVRMDRS